MGKMRERRGLAAPGGRFDHYASTLGESRTDIGELDPLPCVPAARLYPGPTRSSIKGLPASRKLDHPAITSQVAARTFLCQLHHFRFERYRGEAKVGLT